MKKLKPSNPHNSPYLEDWQEALRRFGHCFRAPSEPDPRFKAEAVDREVQRIDGEFQDGLSAGLRSRFGCWLLAVLLLFFGHVFGKLM